MGRYQAVAPVLKVLPGVITFGASAEGAAVLAAMQALPGVLAYRSRLKAPLVPGTLIDPGVVTGPWKRLVFGHSEHEDGRRDAVRRPGRVRPAQQEVLRVKEGHDMAQRHQ